jgi:hypothetical protein
MKLRYAYSSADGLREKMLSVEAVMDGITGRISRLQTRLAKMDKTRLRLRLEGRYRVRWLVMTGICVFVGLGFVARHLCTRGGLMCGDWDW